MEGLHKNSRGAWVISLKGEESKRKLLRKNKNWGAEQDAKLLLEVCWAKTTYNTHIHTPCSFSEPEFSKIKSIVHLFFVTFIRIILIFFFPLLNLGLILGITITIGTFYQ